MKLLRQPLDWIWISCGAVLLGSVGAWSLLSHSFVYGQGYADRPIITFLLLYGLAWGAFAIAARRLSLGERPGLRGIVLVALTARLLLLPSSLIQENDVYRYVLDGEVLLHGENPYRFAPLEVAGRTEFIPDAGLDSPQAEVVLSRIGYPEIPTVYPPASQVSFALGALLAGWHWQGQRWVFGALDLLVLYLIVVLLRASGRPSQWVLLYGWNPLILKEVSNSTHVDVLAAVFILMALWMSYRYQGDPTTRAAALSGAMLGIAVLAKLYPLILLPALCVVLYRKQGGWRHCAAGILGCGAVVAAGYAPFLNIGWRNLTRGLHIFAELWKMNEGAFGLLQATVPEARVVAGLIVATIAILIPVLRQDSAPDRVVRDVFWVLLCWFLFIPTPFPWYAVSLVAAASVSAEDRPILLTLSGCLALYYLSFFYQYRDYSAIWWPVTRTVEHLAIWGAVVWVMLRASRTATGSAPGI